MKPAMLRDVQEYQREDGTLPFSKWFRSLKDQQARTKVAKILNRMESGILGDYKFVGEGVFECRIHYGPGYRIYFGLQGEEVILLLCGGDKSSQQSDIHQAKDYWADYRLRRKRGSGLCL